MVVYWQEMVNQEATVQNMVKALKDAGLANVAHKVFGHVVTYI